MSEQAVVRPDTPGAAMDGAYPTAAGWSRGRRFASLLVLLVAALASMATSQGYGSPGLVEHEESIELGSDGWTRDYLVVFEGVNLAQTIRGVVRFLDADGQPLNVEARIRTTAEPMLAPVVDWRPPPFGIEFPIVRCDGGCQVGLQIEARRSPDGGFTESAPQSAMLSMTLQGEDLPGYAQAGSMSLHPAGHALDFWPVSSQTTFLIGAVGGAIGGLVLMVMLQWLGRPSGERLVWLSLGALALAAAGAAAMRDRDAPAIAVVVALLALAGSLATRVQSIDRAAVGVLAAVVALGPAGAALIRLGEVIIPGDLLLVGGVVGVLVGGASAGLLLVRWPRPPEMLPARRQSVLLVVAAVVAGSGASLWSAVVLLDPLAPAVALLLGASTALVMVTGWIWWRTGHSAPCHQVMIMVILGVLGWWMWTRLVTLHKPASAWFEFVALAVLLAAVVIRSAVHDRELRHGPTPSPFIPDTWRP